MPHVNTLATLFLIFIFPNLGKASSMVTLDFLTENPDGFTISGSPFDFGTNTLTYTDTATGVVITAQSFFMPDSATVLAAESTRTSGNATIGGGLGVVSDAGNTTNFIDFGNGGYAEFIAFSFSNLGGRTIESVSVDLQGMNIGEAAFFRASTDTNPEGAGVFSNLIIDGSAASSATKTGSFSSSDFILVGLSTAIDPGVDPANPTRPDRMRIQSLSLNLSPVSGQIPEPSSALLLGTSLLLLFSKRRRAVIPFSG